MVLFPGLTQLDLTGPYEVFARMPQTTVSLVAATGLLPLFGAEPVDERVVVDRDGVTPGGVTAGVAFALTVAAELFGVRVAQGIQLAIEYTPAPPFHAGSPHTAPEHVRRAVLHDSGPALADRRIIAERVATGMASRRD